MKHHPSLTVIIIKAVLIGILGLHCWQLIDKMHSPADHVRVVAEANTRLMFRHGIGVDVHGEQMDPRRIAGTRRTLAFLLRDASLSADAEYWRQVADLLPKTAGIRLVGYCDGSACADRMRSAALLPGVPVVAFGEAIDTQAVLNADLTGNALLKGNLARSRSIPWRDQGTTPAQVVGSISQ